MRFEAEIRLFLEDDDSDIESALIVVAWRYAMPFDAVARYFDATEGLRWPH